MAEGWITLPIEMKIAVISQLINNPDALDLLRIFAQTNKESYSLTQDKLIWRHLLQTFFPATAHHHYNVFLSAPKELFKKLYFQFNECLKKEGLNWKIYQDFISQKDTLTTKQQQNKMLILKWVSGIEKNIDARTLNKEELDYACIQSTLTGRTEIIAQRLMQGNIILLSTLLQRLFKASAEQNNVQLAESLLNMASLVLGKNTQVEAIQIALKNHNIAFALHFTKKIIFSLTTYSLMPLLKIALQQCCDEFIINILKNRDCKLSPLARNELFQMAAAAGQEKIVYYFLQNESSLSKMNKEKALLAAGKNNQAAVLKLLLIHMGDTLSAYSQKSIIQTEGFKNCGISAEQLMGKRYYEIGATLQTMTQALNTLALTDENEQSTQISSKSYTPQLQIREKNQYIQKDINSKFREEFKHYKKTH